jgi:hypothetical protein
MSGLKLNKFGGEIPRANPRTLTPNTASIALDVNLDEGTLHPWRERLLIETKPFDILSMFRADCCWLAAETCADYALVQPTCDLIVRTGAQDYPEIATFEEACADQWCRLGVPCPVVAPAAMPASPPAVVDRITSLRSYRYVWVNKYRQEGPGSPPSTSFDVNDGDTVIVSIPPCPDDPTFCITETLLYRSGSPFESGAETSNPQNTEWFLVARLPCGTTIFTDTIRDIDLSSGLSDLAIYVGDERLPPPADLKNVLSLENGSLTGISGRFIVQSEPYAPHSWPLKFYKALWQDDVPVRIAAIKDVVYVGTTGFPYTIQTAPDCNTDGRQGVYRHREPLPIVAPRSMAAGSGVVYYASKDGLVALSGTQSRVVGEQLWSKRQWQALHPNLMLGIVFDGHYFGFTDVYGFRLKTADPEHIDAPTAALTRLSDRPRALWTAPSDGLYMAIEDRIEQWNAGAAYRPYLWRSIQYSWARRTSLTAAYAISGYEGPIKLTLISDKGDFVTDILDEEVFRVVNWFSVAYTEIQFQGTGELEEFAVGTSYKEAYRAGATV